MSDILKKILAQINEMTMKAGDLSSHLKKTLDHLTSSLTDDQLRHFGDINDIKVMRHEDGLHIIDFLVKRESRIGFMSGTINHLKIGPVLVIDEWYIIPEEQRKDLGAKYLYFLKNVLKHRVMLGSVHSSATQDFLKKQHQLKRFSLSWYNLKTDEKQPFEKVDDKYSLLKKTDWQVLIESDGFGDEMFNQFKENDHGIRNSYDWLFDNIENLS